ncbi:MAG: prolipoprotein diacylglyceryl transferase [Tepidisphaeraceae bacterium]
MLQELFRIPIFDMPVYGYGLMMVIGFLLAMELAKFLARRSGLDPETFVNAGLIAILTGVIGSRLSHVFENWSEFTASPSAWENLKHMANIRSGGLTFYGGLLFATPMCILYGVYKKVPLRIGMDIIAPCVMVGLAFGRIGCFLNGCCYGAECHVPWAVTFPYHSNAYVDQWHAGEIDAPPDLVTVDDDGNRSLLDPKLAARSPELKAQVATSRSLAVHPAQLYSTFNALLIAAALVAFYTIPHVPGRVFALMFILKGITRFLLEMLRVEPPVMHVGGWGLSFSMVISLLLIAAGIVLWYVFPTFGREWPVRGLESKANATTTSKPAKPGTAAMAS